MLPAALVIVVCGWLYNLGLKATAWSWLPYAIAFKLIPIFLIPVWMFALGGRSVVLGITAAIPALLAVPFGGVAAVLGSLRSFADVTCFNDLVWWFLELVTVQNPTQRNWPFTLVLIAVTLVLAWRLRSDWPRAIGWATPLSTIMCSSRSTTMTPA